MKNISKYILILTLIGGIFFSSTAKAVVKLDFFAMPESLATRLERLKHKNEEIYNKQMNDLQKKVLQASGAEGGALYIILQQELSGLVHQTADTAFSQVKSGNFDLSAFSNIYKMKGDALLEMRQASQMLEDYDKARAAAQEEKIRAIEARLRVLQMQIRTDPTIKDNSEKQTEIALEIATLEEQIKALELENAKQDAQRDLLEGRLNDAAAKLKKIASLEEAMKKSATEGIDYSATGLFPEEDENQNAENEALYGADAEKFFLAQHENENSETIARVKKARNTEYYLAVQNVLRATTKSNVTSNDIEKTAKAYTKKTGEVDGLYGGMAMKIGVDIQTARAAARYTELLLAELRMSAMSEMQNWNSIYKMRDYEKDLTSFNLDDYILKKNSSRDDKEDDEAE